MARTKVKNVVSPVLYFSSRHFFPARLDFPSPLLSAHGYQRMGTKFNRDNRKMSQTEKEKYIE